MVAKVRGKGPQFRIPRDVTRIFIGKSFGTTHEAQIASSPPRDSMRGAADHAPVAFPHAQSLSGQFAPW